ncbi:hypothetical protein CcaverHIS002_0600230 [Cutaneotrichosporon cavernicola]|uniref:Major facilitator superfamily (MFS) profile domain-containing protein n=1 Tax=Cutaneotrichosporon cavernicola TaxID=279322 RepID=A0AA48L5K6_9TREE|nr:uncharacterized protein CcaverHIS019_0500320 [Cutaneotrichosporon cavernicola]BEI85736.1 hypothetical protein CcaverHIS002_0600230 [Cutaneotrichosporon cavernicola]BEI92404.1 hypothetical protein CcaverHIS019_0500320 [Cutaneotrichosporon cavernicola]BEJ00177.1 hypothetical protein CcaverHIS631_0500340 [Cutaneotrichosporon cavernicola]BEJ07948.1 hypothetical protein CcaverHIS641_0500330 [Cutaneotrichosporon cavernicola]
MASHYDHDTEKGYDEKVEVTHVPLGRRRSSVVEDFQRSVSRKDTDQVVQDDLHRQWLDVDEGLDLKQVARINRKIDWRLLPILGAMYTISQIDRGNLGLARSANNGIMNVELGLTTKGPDGKPMPNNRYSIITLAFFVPYLVLEVPSQIGLRKFGAKIWLGTAVLLWGVVMVGMGLAPNWQTLAGLRALLGAFEAVLFPGATYLIACWYPRKQMASRNAWFYITSIMIAGLSSALAYGLSQMNGIAGRSGWRWIFIVEGCVTIVIGLLGYLLIVDFPDRATFLTEEERAIVLLRIERDRADSSVDPMTWSKFVEYMLTPKLWLFSYFFCSSAVGVYALAFFLPGILQSMGFSNIQAQLLFAPPYVWVFFPAMIGAYTSDHLAGPTRMVRGPVVAFHALCVVVGITMFSQLPSGMIAARYTGVFLTCGGCNANIAMIISWCQTSIRSQSKRGFASALVVAGGALSGIIVAVAFKDNERERGYPTGIFLSVGMNALVVIGAPSLSLWMLWKNRKADRGDAVIENDVNFHYQP